VKILDALVRVSRGEGQPVYIIDTEFGGGKTHTLILLYHIFKNDKLAKEYIRQYGLDEEYGILEAPQANVVAIDCRRLTKRTLWGEIADSLGKYNEIREFDENRQQIRNIDVLKSFFNGPTLLLIDELPWYLLSSDAEATLGNITLADLTIAFIMNLISAVAASRNTILIMTLTAKQQLYEKYSEKIRSSLKSKSLGDGSSTTRN
jgi:predicted AAA+ superfamily ATPase